MESAVRQFEQVAIEHGRFPDERSNAYADELANLGRQLRESGEIGQRPLTEHENVSVRLWAATYLLDLDPSGSQAVLESIREGGIRRSVGFSAEVTLTEWRAGRLSLE